MKYISYINILALILLLLSSCKHDHAPGDGHDHEGHDHGEVNTEIHTEDDGHGHDGEEHHEEGSLVLTDSQIATIGLEFGSTTNMKVNNFVNATGRLGIPSNAQTTVSAKAAGILSSNKKFVEGNFIKKGSLIGYIENPEFISKQEEYLQTKTQLTFVSLELQRQQLLVSADAGVERDLQKLQSQQSSLLTSQKSLSKYLSYMGIDASTLTADNLTDRISLYASNSGYISSIKMHNGMYVTPDMGLVEVINTDHQHLELDIFEQDISSIKVGARLSYTIPSLGSQVFEGNVNVISKEFNPDDKTIRVHGHQTGDKPKFIKDLFINAKIWLDEDTSPSLPSDAIVRDEGMNFVYAGDPNAEEGEVDFTKIMVVPGASDNGFTTVSLIDTLPANHRIVTKGAYYVYAQSKAGELAHEH